MSTTFQNAHSQLAPNSAFGNSGLVSVSEPAARTNTGEETLQRAIRAGRIPAFGTRGRLRVRICDVMPEYVPQRKRARDSE